MRLVSHGKSTVFFVCCNTEKPERGKCRLAGIQKNNQNMATNPASPSFCHISMGNSFCWSVRAATSSGISRP